jgi:hypothetical protein
LPRRTVSNSSGNRFEWLRGDRAGIFRRDVGDGQHAEIVTAERVYRVWTTELG